MNSEIGTEAAQFPVWEYFFQFWDTILKASALKLENYPCPADNLLARRVSSSSSELNLFKASVELHL